MRTLFLATSLLASPLAWAQDADEEAPDTASESAEEAPEAGAETDETAPAEADTDEADTDEAEADEADRNDAGPPAEGDVDSEAVPTDDGEAAPDDEPDSDEGVIDDSEEPTESDAEPTTVAPPPAPVAHGADVPTPADRVGKKPNKPLLYAAGGLAAATAVSYGIAYSSYSQAFNADTPPYEDFEQIRQRTNALTVVTGGLAAATIGTGVTAFVVGEF